MSTRFMVIMCIFVLSVSLSFAGDDLINGRDAAILKLVLNAPCSDGSYRVVEPEASLGLLTVFNDQFGEQKQFIIREFRAGGWDIPELVDQLFERNKKAVLLSLRSSPEHGYVIDYEHRYAKYFTKHGGGWDKWYKENPKAHGVASVSLPAYDEKSGLVLVCKGVQTQGLSGYGDLILYRYEDGRLTFLHEVNVWRS